MSKKIIFESNPVETELVSVIVNSQKDILLKSKNIFEDFRNMLNNPNVLELTKNISNDTSQSESKHKPIFSKRQDTQHTYRLISKKY